MTRLLSPDGWAAVGVAAVVLLAVIFGFWWVVVGGPAHDRAAKVEARAGQAIAQGAAGAARDAQGVVIAGGAREAGIDDQTRRNQDAIQAAPNAGVPAGAVGAAGLRGLCQRPAYRDVERCRQLLGSRP